VRGERREEKGERREERGNTIFFKNVILQSQSSSGLIQ
jgi:hypothetical protein